MRSPLFLASIALFASACSSSSNGSSTTPPQDGGADAPPSATLSDGLPATCSPLRVNGACMLPWPNAIYTEQDATTLTGVHLSIPSETMPVVAGSNKPLDTTRYNHADGFSPATPIVAYFTDKIDPASLVPPTDPASSTTGPSATVIVDMTTNARVAHFSEVDATVREDADRQALLIHPLQRLQPNHRYAVAITTRAKTTTGQTPSSPPQFAAIADGHAPSDAMAEKQAARMPDILKALAAAGVQRSDLVLAWDFVTGSDEQILSHLSKMREQANQQAGASGIGYTITSVDENPSPQILRRIKGTFTVPQFLTSVDPTKPDTRLNLDASGNPVAMGTYEAPFEIIVPPSAATTPAPLVLYGHGLLGDADEVSQGAATKKLAAEKNYILFATDQIGLSANESPLGGSNGAIGTALTDINHIGDVTDRLQQAVVNMIVLARTVRGKIVNDPKMATAGAVKLADPSKLYYWGISFGGILGATVMGWEEDITQGVLGVPGGFWSLLFTRSIEWRQLGLLINGPYPDYLDKQLLLALVQMDFDTTDPASMAPYLLGGKIGTTTNAPPKQILAQMSVDDEYVTNWSTETLARTWQIPLLGPSALPIYGMTPANAPQTSALTVWNIHPMPVPPPTNATPTTDNGAHSGIHTLQPLQDQIDQFFKTGQVENTCNGPCDFPK